VLSGSSSLPLDFCHEAYEITLFCVPPNFFCFLCFPCRIKETSETRITVLAKTNSNSSDKPPYCLCDSLCAPLIFSFSVKFVSYQRKVGDSSSRNFLLITND
jgi:hypothetical protein